MISLKEQTTTPTPKQMDESKDSYQWVYNNTEDDVLTFGTDSYFTVTYNIPSAGTYMILNSTIPYGMYVDDEDEVSEFPSAKQYEFTTEGIHTIKFLITKNRTSLGTSILSGISNVSKISFENCDLPLTSLTDLFEDTKVSSVEIDVHGLKKCNLTKLSSLCHSATTVTSINANYFNTSKVTTLSTTFWGATHLTSVGDLSNWDVSHVTSMMNTFAYCYKLESIGDLSNWNTSSVTSMTNTFCGCYLIDSLGDLSKWNTSKNTTMQSMFLRCSKIVSLGDLSQWNTAKVNYMRYAFASCYSLISVGNLGNWCVSGVTNMSKMFSSCTKLKYVGDLSNWDISSIVTGQTTDESNNPKGMFRMFQQCYVLNNLGVPPIKEGVDCRYMFLQCSGLTNITASGQISETISFSDSPLTHDSAMVLIKALDENVSGKTLTLKASTKALLSEAELQIATDKGWTVAPI